MNTELLVSVSGIRGARLEVAAAFVADLDQRQVPISLLVAPRLKGQYKLIQDPATQEWLRERQTRGDAIVLNGYDQAATKRMRAEFAALPAHEAKLRLLAADRAMDHMGLRTRLFAPPCWVASAGALRALPHVGFRMCADLTSIRDLDTGTTVQAKILATGEGLLSEAWWCRALVMNAERVARRGGIVRLAIEAKHLLLPGPRQAFLDAIDLCLHHGARPQVYRWPYGSAAVDAA